MRFINSVICKTAHMFYIMMLLFLLLHRLQQQVFICFPFFTFITFKSCEWSEMLWRHAVGKSDMNTLYDILSNISMIILTVTFDGSFYSSLFKAHTCLIAALEAELICSRTRPRHGPKSGDVKEES